VQLVKLDDISGDDELVSVHQFVQLEAQEANFVDIHNGYDIPYLTLAMLDTCRHVLYTPLCIFAMMSVISANFMNFLIKMRG
jgi:hypothetical protein